ncbi:2Fe-2S iron-sulfur cluster binding domain-containing protein [Ferrimonas gelatinilytica]|uniref:NQR complex subunit F n=1 Tax=Ferrimonas gelatinilytica TaxID=1255257 RepID=A0ABP9SEI9_9GAMM
MKRVQKIHKWAALLAGTQFLIWIATGLYFNLVDHERIAGHQYLSHNAMGHGESPRIEPGRLAEIGPLLAQLEPAQRITLTEVAGRPTYKVEHERRLYAHFAQSITLIDAYTGEPFTIDAPLARTLAKESYTGPGQIIDVTFFQHPPREMAREQNPVWRVQLADDLNTRVYVEALSGRIAGHKNKHTYEAQWMFMLHFMDYLGQGSFNNPFMWLFGFIVLWLSGSGLYWTLVKVHEGDYRLSLAKRSHALTLVQGDTEQRLDAPANASLLSVLQSQSIPVQSGCGGGGSCGLCKVRLSNDVRIKSAERAHLSEQEQAQGYRLACQHRSNETDRLELSGDNLLKTQTLTLVASRFLTPEIKELRFKAESALAYRAGAHVQFLIPAGRVASHPVPVPEAFACRWKSQCKGFFPHGPIQRSYSIANTADESKELVFTVKFHRAPGDPFPPGIGSAYLCNLPVGAKVQASLPVEEFGAALGQHEMILIGAGSGIAPLRSLLMERIGQRDCTKRISLYYGAREACDLVYVDELHQLAEQHNHFRFYPSLSQPNDQWQGHRGYAQHHAFDNLDEHQIREGQFYLCGPAAMMAQTTERLRALGVAERRIHSTQFGPTVVREQPLSADSRV